jgi:hypothetical protein
MSSQQNPLTGVSGVGGSHGVGKIRAPEGGESEELKPGTLSIFDSDMDGKQCPDGFAQFKGDGKTNMGQVTGRVMELADMGQYAPVTGDAAKWASKRNNLPEDPSLPIPMGKDVGIPIHELKSILRMLEPKLKQANQQVLSNTTATVTDSSGVQRTIGNVPSGFRPLPDE